MKKREYLIFMFLFLILYKQTIVIEANSISLSNLDEYEEIYLPQQEELVGVNEEFNDITSEIPTENTVSVRSAEAGTWIWPTADYYPVICTYLCYTNHHAIDVYGPVGTPLYAGRDGVVVQVINSCPSMSANKKECGGGYGNYITIKHSNGVYSRYAHLDAVYVRSGQKVSAGNHIGTIGTSGRVGAAHLHFEIRENTKGMASGGWDPLDKSRFKYRLPGEKNSNKIGWIKSNNQWYFYKNGIAQRGWLKDQNQWYYLNSGGAMLTGWQKIDNQWYYLNSGGAMLTGWQKIDNQWYYFYTSGIMATNTIIDNWKIDSSGVATRIESEADGWIQVGNKWSYYIQGHPQRGWVKSSDEWYFLNSESIMLTGLQFINNERYYFYDSGKMATNTIIDKWIIDENGIVSEQNLNLNGWVLEQDNWYYYVNNVKQTGWLTLGNTKYYLDSNGKMYSDCWVDISNTKYYFNVHGEMVKGWMKWRNQWYYLNNSGQMLTQGTVGNWIITPSGMAYMTGKMNPDYVVNKSIDRLVKLDYTYNPNLNKTNATYKTISGTTGYDEALTEAVVVQVLTNNSKEFNVYLEGNEAHIFYK